MYKVGIELEIKPAQGETRRTILAHLNSVGIPIEWEGYTHDIMNRWKAVSDITVSSGGGFELVSKPMSGIDEIESEVSKMCEALKGKARVDRSCGHHIHVALLEKYWAHRRVDVSTTNGRREALKQKQVKIFCGKLARNYSYFQSVIDSIVAPSRRTSQGAYNTAIPSHWATMTDRQIETQVSTTNRVQMDRRHCVVNYDSLVVYGTVEFRQFQGTINKVKILNWMRLTERFIARTADRKYKGREPMDYPQTINGMCDFLGFGKYGVRRWATQRALSNGFGHLVTQSVPMAQTQESSEETAPSDSTNSGLCEHTSQPLRTCDCGSHNASQNRAFQTELTENILVLENNYNSYHRIMNVLGDYANDIIGSGAMAQTVARACELNNDVNIDAGHNRPSMLRGIIRHFTELRIELLNDVETMTDGTVTDGIDRDVDIAAHNNPDTC